MTLSIRWKVMIGALLVLACGLLIARELVVRSLDQQEIVQSGLDSGSSHESGRIRASAVSDATGRAVFDLLNCKRLCESSVREPSHV